MKKIVVVCSAVFALSVSADLLAQTRGSRYNPPSGGGGGGGSSSSGGGGSSSSSSGSSSRGSSYNPPSRSSSSSSSSSSPSSSSSSSSSPSYSSPSYSSPSYSSPSSSSAPSRGSNYNPPSSSSSSSSSTPSTSSSSSAPSRGSNYNPPSSSSSSSSSTPSTSSSSSAPSRGSNYNPPVSGSTTGSVSTGSTSTTTSTYTSPRGPRYNPPGTVSNPTIPRGPRYNPPTTHTPVVVTHGPRYNNPRDYYTGVPTYYIYRRWVQYPVHYWYYNGYWEIDGYPYYVNHGYRYRYSQVDLCQYELVDANDYTTVRTFPVQACTTAYDQCAVERDQMNRSISTERYFCAEAVEKDQEVADASSYRGSAVEMTDAKRAEIKAYLSGMNYKDIFRDGTVGACQIVKIGGIFSSSTCKYQVNVNEKAYPAVDGSVCSAPASAEAVDCNVGNEKMNAGCILKQAIESGYCL